MISPLMIVGLFFMTASRVFAFAMDLYNLRNFIYSLSSFTPFIIYFILSYFRLKARGGFKKLLELSLKKRSRVYRFIKLIDKILFNPFILLVTLIIFFFSVIAVGLLPFFGTVWRNAEDYWLISIAIEAGCILYFPTYFLRYLIKKSLKSESKKRHIDYRRSGLLTLFVGIVIFLLGLVLPMLGVGVGLLIGAIGVGQIIAGYLYTNGGTDITKGVKNFDKK